MAFNHKNAFVNVHGMLEGNEGKIDGDTAFTTSFDFEKGLRAGWLPLLDEKVPRPPPTPLGKKPKKIPTTPLVGFSLDGESGTMRERVDPCFPMRSLAPPMQQAAVLKIEETMNKAIEQEVENYRDMVNLPTKWANADVKKMLKGMIKAKHELDDLDPAMAMSESSERRRVYQSAAQEYKKQLQRILRSVPAGFQFYIATAKVTTFDLSTLRRQVTENEKWRVDVGEHGKIPIVSITTKKMNEVFCSATACFPYYNSIAVGRVALMCIYVEADVVVG